MLVEGFGILGVHIQYWMPLAVSVAAVGIAISLWTGR
jgi:hypothetical protein